MVVKAYLMAAEPSWIEASVRSYYEIVDEIIVSYDGSHRGWTGAPIPVEECLERLRAIDRDGKMRFCPGDFARLTYSPMENDTHQRLCAQEQAGQGADWVLAFDTDEILPNAQAFARRLQEVPRGISGVEWPMRAFFRHMDSGVFLEVCTLLRRQISEFNGCIAVRPGTLLCSARYTLSPRWKFDIRNVGYDVQSRRRYPVHGVITKDEAILHLSWARSETDMLGKLASWSHNADFNTKLYFEKTWKPSLRKWMWMYNFHPVTPKRWPALRPTRLPLSLLREHAPIPLTL